MPSPLPRGQEIILPPSALRALADAAAATPGAEGALRDAGREVGRILHPLVLQEDPGTVQGDFWDRLQRHLARRGLGLLTHRRIHPGIGLLECGGLAERSGASASGGGAPFTTGLLQGILSAAAGRAVDLRPIDAAPSAGSSDSARWIFGSPAALDALQGELGGGATLEDAVARL